MNDGDAKALYPLNLDPSKLEPYYSRHVSAMTGEQLEGKSAIAEQLAWRDKELEAVRLELAREIAAHIADSSALATERARAEEAERRLALEKLSTGHALDNVGKRLAAANARAEEAKKREKEAWEFSALRKSELAAANARAEEAEEAVALLEPQVARLTREHLRLEAKLAAANARAERLETALKVLATGFRAEGDDHWNEAARRAERALGAALSAAPQASTEQGEHEDARRFRQRLSRLLTEPTPIKGHSLYAAVLGLVYLGSGEEAEDEEALEQAFARQSRGEGGEAIADDRVAQEEFASRLLEHLTSLASTEQVERRPECPHGVGLCTSSCPSKEPKPIATSPFPQVAQASQDEWRKVYLHKPGVTQASAAKATERTRPKLCHVCGTDGPAVCPHLLRPEPAQPKPPEPLPDYITRGELVADLRWVAEACEDASFLLLAKRLEGK